MQLEEAAISLVAEGVATGWFITAALALGVHAAKGAGVLSWLWRLRPWKD